MKNSKRNIVISAILSLALCVSLIAGATFALFTSESNVNIAVTSGKVNVVATIPNESLKLSSLKDIDMNTFEGTEVDRTTEGTFLTGGTATLSDGTLTLDRIMPGDKATFRIIVHNDSNVKVKFRTKVKAENDDGLLAGLKFNIGIADNAMVSAWQEMAVGADDIIYNCYVELPASAGNAYMGKSCKLVFGVEAVQGNAKTTNEVHYPVDSDSLKSSLAEGGTVYVNKDIAVEPTVTDSEKQVSGLVPQTLLNKDTTIDLKGNSIGVKWDSDTDYGKASPVLMSVMGGTLTIGGDGEINCESGSKQVYGINVIGGNVVINDGKFYGAMTAVQVQKGSLEINGGFFDMAPTCKAAVPQFAKYVVNCIDAAYRDGSATISIKGGTFVNFDPSANPEGAGTSYVAEGYAVFAEVKGEDTWYTVVKGSGTGVVAGSKEEITDAITGNDAVTVKITNDGTYTLPSLEGKDVTIIGTKDTVIDMKEKLNNGATNVSLEGVTVEFGSSDYKGFQHTGKLTYKDCVIKGKQFLYGENVEFIGCTFEQENVDYNVWTYGAGSVLFENCVFNCVGKAVLIYNEGHIGAQSVEFRNCTFNASAPVEGKAAIEIDSSFNVNYTVIIDKATSEQVTGFGLGSVSGNSVWNEKKGNKTTVVVNGETVRTANV